LLCLEFELSEGFLASVTQGAFIGAGTAADDVADASEEILEDVGTHDHLAGDNAIVVKNGAALDGGRGSDDHRIFFRGLRTRIYNLEIDPCRSAGLVPSDDGRDFGRERHDVAVEIKQALIVLGADGFA